TAAADLYTRKSDAHGEVEFKSAAKAHARVAESKGHKERNAPHETDRGSFITHTDKNGTRKYTYADRTTETVSKDGQERDVMYPDGSGYQSYRDGSKLIRNDDGSRDFYDANGNIEWRLRVRRNGDDAYTDEKGRLKEYADKNRDHYA